MLSLTALCQHFATPQSLSSSGKDLATSVEVFWPDGRSVARPLEPSDMNTVLEILYPVEEDEATTAAEIEVGCTVTNWAHNSHSGAPNGPTAAV